MLVVGVSESDAAEAQTLVQDVPQLTTRQKIVLTLFAATFLTMIYGFIPWNDLWQEGFGKNFPLPTFHDFYFPEAAGLFLVMAVVIGLIARLGEEGTAGPALGLSLFAFLVLGFLAEPKGAVSTEAALDVLEHEFNISALNLLPLALLVVFTLKKVPPFLAILGSALFAGILACFTQWTVVKAFVDEPGRSAVGIAIKGIYAAMATGFVSKTGNPGIDQLFSRGGMASLLTTIWLVLATLSFAAIMEYAGFLERLLRPVVARAPTRGRLIAAVSGSGIGLNVIAGDQYVADVLPSRMFTGEFERRGLAPQVLSRAVEDSGTVTSVLVPWNTCGAYISGVLGVSTASYFQYCFFNFLSPVLDVVYGFIGFKVPSAQEAAPAPARPPAPVVHAGSLDTARTRETSQ